MRILLLSLFILLLAGCSEKMVEIPSLPLPCNDYTIEDRGDFYVVVYMLPGFPPAKDGRYINDTFITYGCIRDYHTLRMDTCTSNERWSVVLPKSEYPDGITLCIDTDAIVYQDDYECCISIY